MTINNAVKTASLLAAVLLAVPAFAGEAVYNSSHTVSDTQIQSNVVAPVSTVVTYVPGTGIDVDFTGSLEDFSYTNILNSVGGELNTPLNEAVHVEYTIVSATLPDDPTGGMGLYIDIPDELDGTNDGQVVTGVRNDTGESGLVYAFMGAHGFTNWQWLHVNLPNWYVQTAAPVTFPVDFVVDITAGGTATLTVNGTVAGSIDLTATNSREVHYRQRLFKGCINCTNFGAEMVVDDIRISGVSIPDVNLAAGPTNIVYVDFGYSGLETGAESLPWNLLSDALAVVDVGGIINIKGNTGDSDSPETLTINQDVTINAVGGTVSIGDPGARSADDPVQSGFISRNRD